MKYFTESIIQFAEDSQNFPELVTSTISTDTVCGDISRFIYSNQSVKISLTTDVYQCYQTSIQIVRELDSDIRENQKFYADGVAFCEFYCNIGLLRIDDAVFDKLYLQQKSINCMVYGIEMATEETMKFLKALTQDTLLFEHIPKFEKPIKSNIAVSQFKTKRYYPFKTFINHANRPGIKDAIDEKIDISMLFLNIPYEIYSECLNNMHHLNYNYNYNEFMCLRKSLDRFDQLFNDIQENGIKTPLTFKLWHNQLIPIENSSRILMVLLLKLPIVPACVYYTEFDDFYENVYFDSKNTLEKMNSLFNPYFIFGENH